MNFTIPANTYCTLIHFQTNTDGEYSVFHDIQLEKNSAATSYVPYSNVCPITGWTGARVTRTGKNLFDKSKAVLNDNVARFIDYGVDVYGYTQPNRDCILDVGTYTFSISGNGTAIPSSMRVYDSSGNRIAIIYNNKILTFTTTSAGAYHLEINFNDTVTWADYNIQLELGSTATAYEPYSGTTTSISWESEAGTVYGGTLDVTNGVLTVDRAQIAHYNGETLPGEWISDRDAYAPGTTPTTRAQVVYELATPITYTLTPQEISTLLGTNNFWADVGDTTVTYECDINLDDKKALTPSGLTLVWQTIKS